MFWTSRQPDTLGAANVGVSPPSLRTIPFIFFLPPFEAPITAQAALGY